MLARLLAAIGVITDSAVLVIGAMVVGPEFGTVAAVATGLVLRQPHLTTKALRLLVSGIVVSVAVVALLSLVAGLTGLIAGVLALTTARANAMVGVFISVTTIPAVGNLALAIGVWAPSEISGSLAQLGANIAGMVVAGVLVLALQRLLWVRTLTAAQRLFTRGDQGATR